MMVSFSSSSRSVVLILLLTIRLQAASSFILHCSRRCVPTSKQRHPNQILRIGDVGGLECLHSKSSSSDDSGGSNYFNHLVSQFQGDFDNYNQVLRDRFHALTPAEGGGHEHIHCVLCPLPASANQQQQQQQQHQKEQWILAAFYFNGNPRQIFRFRMYKLISPQENGDDGEKVRMKLHTLSSELEQQLRQYSDQPCTWWRETYAIWLNNFTKNSEGERSDRVVDMMWKTFQSDGIQDLVSPLVGCDVLWNPQWDPKKHTYLNVDEYDDDDDNIISSSLLAEATKQNDHDEGLHATMEAGSKGAIVDSISLIPGKRILIKDELSLWENEFWINDRGYDPDATIEGDDDDDMPFVYGNRRGIPYKLERVSCISCTKDTNKETLLLERTVHNQELAWTMGEDYREQAVYEEKLHAVEEALSQSSKSHSS